MKCTTAKVSVNSDPKLGLLDAVLAVSALNDGVNVCVELAKLVDLGLDLLGGSGVVPQVSGLTEEIGTETLVRVNKNAVLVGVTGGGGILAEHGHVPDEVGLLGVLGGSGLFGGFVVDADHVMNGTLNLNNVKDGSEA